MMENRYQMTIKKILLVVTTSTHTVNWVSPESRSHDAYDQGNGIAERLVRTLKESLLWIRRFDTVEEHQLALVEFKDTYNREWIIGLHSYKTPSAARPSRKLP